MSFSFDVPLPPRELSPNARVNWRERHRATKAYRSTCAWLAKAAMPKGWKAGPVVVSAEYRCHRGAPGYTPFDISNAQGSVKAAIDGFVDAGIAPNDTKRWLTWGSFDLVTRKGPKPAGVTFTFEANP